MSKTVGILLAALALLLCACASAPPQCQRPEWSPGDPATAEDVVLWSAFRWAIDPEVGRSAMAFCGGGLNCEEVATYIRKLGGKVYSSEEHGCAVFWQPEGDK